MLMRLRLPSKVIRNRRSSCFIVISLFFLQQAFAQLDRRVLYFVSGCPEPKTNENYSVALHRFDSTSSKINLVRMLTSPGMGLDQVTVDYDRRTIVVHEKAKTRHFELINMDTPGAQDSFDVNYLNRTVLRQNLLELPGGRLVQSLLLGPEHETGKALSIRPGEKLDLSSSLLIAIDLSPSSAQARTQQTLSQEFGQYVRVGGVGWLEGSGGVHVHSGSDGTLTSWMVNTRADLGYRVPSAISSHEKEFHLEVNNDSVLVLGQFSARVSNPGGLGYSLYDIYDKKNGQWRALQVPGSRSRAVGFGAWIAFSILEGSSTLESPGRSERREKETPFGHPVDWSFKRLKLYSPGMLFLYHAQTQKQYTILTHQGDSQVLVVDGDVVYYRVNRSILKARIGSPDIDKPTVIVEDDIVPDIHWAFLGPPVV